MQEIKQKREQIAPFAPPQVTTSQGRTATQLGLSHIVAGGVALGIFYWMAQLHVPQPYPLLISLATACAIGLLCTLNLQYSLYLLELTLTHLAHGLPISSSKDNDYTKSFAQRWPLSSLFLRLQEADQRVQHYAANEQLTTDLREKTLQQAGETAAQAERNRIARELHDSIKQQIFSISVSAAAAKAHWQGEDAGDAREAVEDIQRSAKEAQVEMQALLQQLRPAPLENTSLVEALGVQAQALGFRTGAQVHMDIGEMPGNDRLLPGTQETIFRLVQEAFANIAKHARASNVRLALHTRAHELCIEVRDDGQGFAMAHVQKGMGLNNLRERAQELHGSVEISSQPGQGTTVAISIPLLEMLSNPEEEARRKYELMRDTEMARRGYQLCENFAPLSMILLVIAGLRLFSISWIIVALCALIAAYGCANGIHYRAQVALNAGQKSVVTLALKQWSYGANRQLIRMLGFCIWYSFLSFGLLMHPTGIWSLFIIFAGVIGLNQIRALLPNTRIVTLTSYTDDARVVAALRAGAIGYVRKEADPEILLSSIRAAARGQSLLDPAVASAVLQELMRGGKHSAELTEREQEVLRQLALGRTNHEIAEALTVSDETVKTHVGNILTKLQLAHRTQAVIYALKKGLISLDEIELP